MELSVRGTPITVTPLLLAALLLSLGAVGYGGYDYVQQSNAVEDAVTVETTVTDTDISVSAGRGLVYRISVEHTYQYRGTEYTSKQVFPGSLGPMYTARSDAAAALAPYEPNTTATAYVDPESPGRAFLERQTTWGPFRLVGLGGLVAVLTVLRIVGARNPGQGTELRPASDHEPTRYETLFGLDRDRVNRLSKHLMVVAPVVFLAALAATVLLVYNADSSSLQVGLTDPVGLALLTAFLAALGLIAALVGYGVWSFTEYRRLRARIPEPRPPSPFRHPTRLVTILSTNDGLDEYGRRVKLTGFAFTVAAFFAGILVSVILF
jgi:hypothetical protein